MREQKKLNIEYFGYNNPETKDELELEILGLELAIKGAEYRIAHLRQALKMALIKQKCSGDADDA